MPHIRRNFRVEPALLAYARKSLDWYTSTGMRPATPPEMPWGVASWICRSCIPLEREEQWRDE